MHIIPFHSDHIPDAANLFAASFRRQREATPALPDTMEHDFRISGERREGLLAGIYTTIEKMSFSIGPALVGFVLAGAGYVASASGDVVQPAAALTAMYVCMAVIPFVMTLVGCVLLRFYTLDASEFGRPAGR